MWRPMQKGKLLRMSDTTVPGQIHTFKNLNFKIWMPVKRFLRNGWCHPDAKVSQL